MKKQKNTNNKNFVKKGGIGKNNPNPKVVQNIGRPGQFIVTINQKSQIAVRHTY